MPNPTGKNQYSHGGKSSGKSSTAKHLKKGTFAKGTKSANSSNKGVLKAGTAAHKKKFGY
jgi:hypothetical protein